jgi:hypothetical protein
MCSRPDVVPRTPEDHVRAQLDLTGALSKLRFVTQPLVKAAGCLVLLVLLDYGHQWR